MSLTSRLVNDVRKKKEQEAQNTANQGRTTQSASTRPINNYSVTNRVMLDVARQAQENEEKKKNSTTNSNKNATTNKTGTSVSRNATQNQSPTSGQRKRSYDELQAEIESLASQRKDLLKERGKLVNDKRNINSNMKRVQEVTKQLNDIDQQMKALEKEAATHDEDKSALERVGSGLGSIGMSLAATVPLLGETAVQAVKNAVTGENEGLDEDSLGMRWMEKANEMRQDATEGMSGLGAFLGDTAISIGQNAAVLPTALINPAVPLVAMGAQAGAQKAYEVQEEGGGAGEALGRGIISGGIEAVTEKIPLDNLLDIIKVGGKGAIKNILKQAGVEATEEGISYTANYIADKATGDPNAQFSVQELLESAAAGGLSGMFFGGAGSAAYHVRDSRIGADYQAVAEDLVNEGLTFAPETEAHQTAQEVKAKMDAGQRVSNAELGRVVVANERAIQAEEQASALALAAEAVEAEQQAASQPQIEVSHAAEQTATQSRKANRAAYNPGYGEKGTQAFQIAVEASGMEPERVRQRFQSAYEAGLTELPRERVQLVDRIQEAAYNAGREDYILNLGKDKGRTTGATIRSDAGFDKVGLPADVTESQWKAVDTLAKATGVKVKMAKGLKGNAEIAEDGTVLIDETFQRKVAGQERSIVFYAAHEIGMHRLMQLAPEEGRAFINAVIRDTNAGLAYGQATVTESKQHSYAAQNVYLSTTDAMEEVAADSILDIYGSDEEFAAAIDRVLNGKDEKAKQGARKFKEILDDIVKKLKQAIAKLTGKEKAEAKQTLAEVENLRSMYETALKVATDRVKAERAAKTVESVGTQEYTGGTTQYSARAERGRSIEIETMENNRFERLRQFGSDLPAEWYAFTRGYFYIYSNQSFMDYTVLAKVRITSENRADINSFLEAFENGTFQPAETFDKWASAFRRGKGRYNWDRVRDGNRGPAVQTHGVDERARGSNHGADTQKNSGTGEVKSFTDPATGENVKWSLRTKEPPKKVGIAYKVFYAKNGQLYPPMVANPGGAGTPVGVWLDADVGVAAEPSKTGRPQVQAGGKGTNAGKMKLAFRPGWHLGDLPMATQFARKNPETGVKDLFPADFVWAECEYAMDHDYQDEAMSYGYTENGKFRHSYAGLPRLPEDGYYRYRTNPNPDTVPWVITGAMRVKRILTDAETDKILRDAGVEPMKRQGGPIDLEKLGLKAGVQYSLKDLDGIKAEYKDKTDHLYLHERNDGTISIDNMVVKKEYRNQGVGTQILNDVIAYADETGKTITLTPTTEFGTKAKLTKWYKANGFVENKGRNADYRLRDTMYRLPKGVKFSLKSPVEETRDLIALHNLTTEKLLKALNLGGFPMPSIAVTKADIPHTDFGDITLVMNKSTIDPRASRKNTVYSADAWTPTFPKVEYDVNREAERLIYEKARKADGAIPAEYVNTANRMASSVEDYVNTYETEEGVVERFKREYAFKALYLADQGERVETKTRENRIEKDRSEMLDSVLELFEEDVEALGKVPLGELHAKYAEDIKRVLMEHGRTEDAAEKMVAKKGGIFGFSKLMSRILRYAETPAVTTETVTDTKAIEADIDSRIDEAAYEKWLADLFKGVIRDSGIYNGKPIFTASGNRRSFQATHYPVTLENIAKEMAAQNDGNSRNVSGFYGVKSLRAGTAVRFKSIAQMHELKGRLHHLTQVEAQAITDALDKRLTDITERIYKKRPGGGESNAFIVYDSIGHILMEVTEQDKYTVDSIQKVFSQYQYDLGNELAADIRDLLFDVSEMPVNIFEAKPERAVRFDEVLAAVVPDDVDAAVVDGLTGQGVNVLPYKAGDDTDRLAKVNSVDNARFSLKEQSDLMKQNAKLKEVNQELREQFKTTKFAKVDKKSLDQFTKQLLRDYSSGADINETRTALDGLYTYLANGEDGLTPSWNEAYKRAYEAAVSILESASVVDDQMYKEYKALRERLRTVGITLERQYSHDLIGYENLEDFRKRNFGRLKIVKDGLPVDVLYQDLAETYPELFDAYNYTTQGDQLTHIAEVLDTLQPVEVNPYSYNMRESATWLANDIMERFFALPQAKPTFADKAAGKLDAQKAKDARKLAKVREEKNERIAQIIAEGREQVKKVQAKERARYEAAEKQLKEHYKDKEGKGRESRKARELREKITRHAKDMSQKLLRPSDKQHIPEALRGAVAALLESINQESQYTIDEATGKRMKGAEGLPTKRTKAFLELKGKYHDILENTDMVIDPALLGGEGVKGDFDQVLEMGDVSLYDMTSAQLETIWRVIRSVEHSVSTAGKVLSKAKFERTHEWANAIVDDTATRRSKKGKSAEAFRIDMENPYTFFSHYGESGKAIFRMLRDAQDRQQEMVEQVQTEVAEIVDPKTVRKWEREMHEFTTERGVGLKLTAAQCMEIHELMKREQARDHLMKGGIVQPEIEHKRIKRGTDAILLTEGDLAQIVGALTDEQVEVADKLQKLTTTTLADFGNEASMKAYGYKKFTGSDYWPIKSAKEAIHSNIEKGGGNTRSIKNISLAKSVIPHASNPLDIGGVFKTFASHAGDMTDYAAWLCPMEDVNRLYNFQFRDELGQQTGKTMKGLLDRVGGKGAQQYWHNLMEDIQNGLTPANDSAFLGPINKVIGNVKGASVGANLRVIVQQPTAILRAAMVLNPADMTAGLVSGGGWKKALEHSSIAKRKAMGGFDISSPMQMQEILFDSKKGLQRFNEAMMAPAGKADALTWGRIWNACEKATKRKHKDLEKGSTEFYEETARLFAEVIDQTQVVDGVLQRSQTMRSGNALMKQATSFMGEPTMAMNMLLRAYDGVANETNPKKRGKAIKTFGRAASVLLMTNAVNALAQSLVDAERDDEDEKYWERFWSAFTGLTGEEETTWEKAYAAVLSGNLGASLNPVGYVPVAKDVLSILQGYNVTRADADVMGDIITASQTFLDSVRGEGKKTLPYATKNMAQQIGKVFGISATNLLRDVWGIMRSVATETDNVAVQYEMEKAIYSIDNTSNKGRFLNILYRAYEQGDMDVYEHIMQDMIDHGIPASSIESGMKSRAKKNSYNVGYLDKDSLMVGIELLHSEEDDGEEDFTIDNLSSRKYTQYIEERGDMLVDIIDDFEKRGFGKLDGETANDLLAAAYSFAEETALENASGGRYETDTKWISKAQDADELGLTASEYIMLMEQYGSAAIGADAVYEAYDKGVDVPTYLEWKDATSEMRADKDENGKSISGSKKAKVIEYMNTMGLTKKEYRVLLEIAGYKMD